MRHAHLRDPGLRLPGLPRSRVPSLVTIALTALLAGCASSQQPAEPATTVDGKRLEESWGPGQGVALLTGTVSSKDRNRFFNVPLLTWYVREEDRKGAALLGGALAYDMVTVERQNGEPVKKQLTSFGLLGLAGRLKERALDGSGQYENTHWVFPFYRFHNLNGERTVYPLMIFPWHLRPDAASVAYDPAPWNTPGAAPIDPPNTPSQSRIGATSISAAAPNRQTPAREWKDVELTRTAPPVPTARPVPQPISAPSSAVGNPTARPAMEARTAQARTVEPSVVEPRVVSTRTATPAQRYTVQKGDTLYSLARRFYGNGNEWRKIQDANRTQLPSADRLQVGMSLQIP